MTKKQLEARVAELEAMVVTLSAAINAMRTPIYVAPVPAQPIVNPLPINPFPMPYIGDPPYPWGPTVICGGNTTGGMQGHGGIPGERTFNCGGGLQEG